ncbi:MAG: propanediol/glycerol family dehydratase medium subunit [Clostridiales bacterium]|nr:propanediol/glycerol family dehydratase medium subunit [Clostridiales bacterium]
MEMNEQLIRAITTAVVEQLRNNGQLPVEEQEKLKKNETPDSGNSLRGRTRMKPRHSYAGAQRAPKGTNPKEVVIGVGAAFQTEIRATITGIPLEEVIRNVQAGIEEEGMVSRVVKVLDTSDVCFMALESAKLSGSGIGIGIQSKGTTVIHQKDLYPLSNLELFPQAPLMTLETYRAIGRNAARYVKGEKVTPIESTNDPMVRAKFQVKAALMHIIETEQLDPEKGMIVWEGVR